MLLSIFYLCLVSSLLSMLWKNPFYEKNDLSETENNKIQIHEIR